VSPLSSENPPEGDPATPPPADPAASPAGTGNPATEAEVERTRRDPDTSGEAAPSEPATERDEIAAPGAPEELTTDEGPESTTPAESPPPADEGAGPAPGATTGATSATTGSGDAGAPASVPPGTPAGTAAPAPAPPDTSSSLVPDQPPPTPSAAAEAAVGQRAAAAEAEKAAQAASAAAGARATETGPAGAPPAPAEAETAAAAEEAPAETAAPAEEEAPAETAAPAEEAAPAEAAPAEEPEPEPDPRRDPLLEALAAELGDDLVATHVISGVDAWARVRPEAWHRAGQVCRDVLGLTYFGFLSAIDWLPSPYGRSEGDGISPPVDATPGSELEHGTTGGATRFQLIARLENTVTAVGLHLKADVPEDTVAMPTWTDLFAGADWHERETREMFGIDFVGHPNLVNLYLPGEFEGFPLRKDYPLLAREVKPWPGLVDVEPMPGEEPAADEAGAEA
jgi:NADH-quinone oxidoreductase subunit C